MIETEAERLAVLDEMTDPAETWMPSGDADFPADMTALVITADGSMGAEEIDFWMGLVDGILKVGHRRLRIDWSKDGFGEFSTTCIVNATGIVYDSMFSNAVGHNSDLVLGRRCLDKHLWWVWQRAWSSDPDDWTRGHLYADDNPTCRNGQVIACDKDCDGSMTGGMAEVECKSTQINESCCQLEYAWAWARGLKKVRFDATRFKFEIEGIIASSGRGNGSCTVCCNQGMNGPGLPGDLDADGSVGHAHLRLLLSSFGVDDGGDLDSDSDTDAQDLKILLADWTEPAP